MPLLLLPIILIAVGIALILVIGMSLFIGVALIHSLFWPVVIGLIVWWVLRRRNGSNRPARHQDWQQFVPRQRKEAHHVHEEKPAHHEHHDDWSDF